MVWYAMAWHGLVWHGVVFHGIVWFWRHWSTVVILRDWCDNGCDTDITDTLQCKELQWDNKTKYSFLDALFRYIYVYTVSSWVAKAMRGLEVASKREENIDLCVEKSSGWWRLTPPPPPPAAAVTRLLGGREKKGGRDGSILSPAHPALRYSFERH